MKKDGFSCRYCGIKSINLNFKTMKAAIFTFLFLLYMTHPAAGENDLPDTTALNKGDWFDLEFSGDLGSGRIPYIPGDESFRGSIWMPDSLFRVTFRCRVIEKSKKKIILSAKVRRVIYVYKGGSEYRDLSGKNKRVTGYYWYDSWYPDPAYKTDYPATGKDSFRITLRTRKKPEVWVQNSDSLFDIKAPFIEDGLKDRLSFNNNTLEFSYNDEYYRWSLQKYFDLWRMILDAKRFSRDTIYCGGQNKNIMQYSRILPGKPGEYYADQGDSSWFAVSPGNFLPRVLYLKTGLWWKVVRITDASFPLPANVYVEYKKNIGGTEVKALQNHKWMQERKIRPDTETDTSVIFRFFLNEPESFSLPGTRIFLMPGDSLVIDRSVPLSERRFSGRGAEVSGFYARLARLHVPPRYQLLEEMLPLINKDFSPLYEKIDSLRGSMDLLWGRYAEELLPYWRNLFRKHIGYWYINEYLTLKTNTFWFFQNSYKDVHIPWDDPAFRRVDPVIDYLNMTYLSNEYSEWCDRYLTYRKYSIHRPTIAPYDLNSEEEMILPRILLRGYPMYFNYVNVLQDMFLNQRKIPENFEKYAGRILQTCGDPRMKEVVKKIVNWSGAIRPGKNIRDLGLYVTDKLELRRKATGYILFTVTDMISHSFLINNFYHDRMEKFIREKDFDKNLKVMMFFPYEQKKYMDSMDLGDLVTVYYMGKDSVFHDRMKVFTDRNTFMLIRNDGVIVNNHVNDDNIYQVLSTLPKRPLSRDWSALYRLLLIIFLAVLLSGGITWGVVRYRSRRLLRREEARRRLAELELRALRSQMNPHFLFNALNSIQNLINKNRIREANLYLSRFASLMRMVLDHAERRLVSLDEEIRLLRTYLELERLRTPFDFSIEVAPEVVPQEEEIPGMLLQPFVENAVLHGMVPARGGKIEITVAKKEGMLRITIADNGQGIRARSTSGKGNGKAMKMIEERIRILNRSGELSVRIEVTDLSETGEGHGTRVIIEIPV